jgi:endonuclease/exonuclease/phosphatase family metal-dependent hydrolase
MRRPLAALLVAAALLSACRTGRNYADADAPRHAGAGPPAGTGAGRGDTLRIVSFNIEFARRIDSAIAALRGDPATRAPDVLLLQEMDEPGTRRVAEAFGMWYVYYPAIYHERAKRDFGNAVLSRWPIVEDARLVLPHRSRYAGTPRTATVATIRVGDALVRVYSTHLGTPLDIGGGSRRAQLRAILADAAAYPRVIVGGDLNDGDAGAVVRDAGYAWPTERGPRTTRFGRWDHVFLRGLTVPTGVASGTVADNRDSSDHLPVWALAVVR